MTAVANRESQLLRRLTAKGRIGSIRRQQGQRDVSAKTIGSFPLSNVTPPDAVKTMDDGRDKSPKSPVSIDLGGQQLSLSSISVGVALFTVFGITWQIITTFSTSLIRLMIFSIIIACVVMLSSTPEKVTSKDHA